MFSPPLSSFCLHPPDAGKDFDIQCHGCQKAFCELPLASASKWVVVLNFSLWKSSCMWNTFPYEWFRTTTRFDAEAKGNLKIQTWLGATGYETLMVYHDWSTLNSPYSSNVLVSTQETRKRKTLAGRGERGWCLEVSSIQKKYTAVSITREFIF